MMSPKITPEHLRRGAVVYVRQSSATQLRENLESQRRQYALVGTAREMGFANVETIDEDLGKSASGLVERPGFARLVAMVCRGLVGAVFCIEASRLARNGRDWHSLIELCALCGTILIDPESAYEPRSMNDRLLLGLKGTMSEYELGLLHQRAHAARDAKAKRGELRFILPAGYCWDELGRIEIDPDARVAEAVRLVFRKFAELRSARQVFLWLRERTLELPVARPTGRGVRIPWRCANYQQVLRMLSNPLYAGVYAFGRTERRTHLAGGRPASSHGHRVPRERWKVLLRDHHAAYITWEQFESNQVLLSENTHMDRKPSRKSGRGGRALLTGLLRCGRCGRMMRLRYGAREGQPHRYLCVGQAGRATKACLDVGGVRVDHAIAERLLDAVAPHAIDAAMKAAELATRAERDVVVAIERELEEARYDAHAAERRHRAVDPDKRNVARELEARWETLLERVRSVEARLANARGDVHAASAVDPDGLLRLARDLVAVWNAEGTEIRTKQRLVHLLICEVVVDRDAATDQTVMTIHWQGGQHTPVRIARVRTGRRSDVNRPAAVEVVRTLAGHFSDRSISRTMNRMGCRSLPGQSWTTARVSELRERLGIPAFDLSIERPKTISVEETALRLGIGVDSVRRLIRRGLIAATQLMPGAPWQVRVDGLESETVRIAVQHVIERRPLNHAELQDRKTLRLPGV
jgi:DNA invertase Pin-like site-specific DNA recombinase